jgi:hypothetical protein
MEAGCHDARGDTASGKGGLRWDVSSGPHGWDGGDGRDREAVGMGAMVAARWAPAIVRGGVGRDGRCWQVFPGHSDGVQIPRSVKLVRTLTDQKFEIKYSFEDLEQMNNLSIETFLDSKGIWMKIQRSL